VGYVAEAPIDSGAITPGHLVEANIDPAEASGGGIDDVRIGVAVFAPDCDASCTDPPVGFGWLDVPVPLPS
jgi:hypothetical protein